MYINITSLSSLAFELLLHSVLVKNPEIKWYLVKLNNYISIVIYDGRYISAYNKAWNEVMDIHSFNECYFYSSTMSIMGISLKETKVLKDQQLNYEFFKKKNRYIANI